MRATDGLVALKMRFLKMSDGRGVVIVVIDEKGHREPRNLIHYFVLALCATGKTEVYEIRIKAAGDDCLIAKPGS